MTPLPLLSKLAQDERSEVRTGVAMNPNTPVELLVKLREPGHYSTVNAALVRNQKLPPALLQDMYNHHEAMNSSFAEHAAGSPARYCA